ncbi:MAG: hypothetical protein WCT03_27565 [Candidatus Obscuribacterales bacterium]|jgi:tetrahydromethanopterin S-methyltransferase subunit F
MGTKKATGSSLPIAAMFVIGIISALVVAGSFEVIKVWPLPSSVVPMFGWKGGLAWGLVVGAVSGLVIGFVTDDSHFEDQVGGS